MRKKVTVEKPLAKARSCLKAGGSSPAHLVNLK